MAQEGGMVVAWAEGGRRGVVMRVAGAGRWVSDGFMHGNGFLVLTSE